MRCPDIPADEPERLKALAEYALPEDGAIPGLDSVMEIAVQLFDVPAAAVNMVGATDTFFAASHGIGACDKRRDVSFCAHAINGTELMVVPDARLDWRFDDNPLVTDGLIIFYAGVPLRSPSGHALGALCIVDSKPRPDLAPTQLDALASLAAMASEQLEVQRLQHASATGRDDFEARAARSPDVVVGFDDNAQITSWNTRAEALFGDDAEAMIGRPLETVVAEADRPALASAIARVLDCAELTGTATGLNALRADGSTFEAAFVWLHLGAVHGGGCAAVVRDLGPLRQERAALYDLTRFDGLTGLANLRQLHDQIDAALAAGQAPALVLFDIRELSALTDWQGQAVADLMLCVIARRLRASLPESVLVARGNGDGFALLIRDGVGVDKIAARARAQIERPMVLTGQQALRIACDSAVAVSRAVNRTADALIAEAESVLKAAKRQGKDRAHLGMTAGG